jgi:hypothetical protein
MNEILNHLNPSPQGEGKVLANRNSRVISSSPDPAFKEEGNILANKNPKGISLYPLGEGRGEVKKVSVENRYIQ